MSFVLTELTARIKYSDSLPLVVMQARLDSIIFL